jgi:hypothetical protein
MSGQSPLADLLLAIKGASGKLSRNGERLFEPADDRDDPIDAVEYVGPFRSAAADLIVWLELKGRPDDAGEIDDAIASIFEVARAYDRRDLKAWLPDDELAGPVEPLDQLVDAMRAAAGRLEDLDAEIPAEVWEGYDDA